MMLPAALQNLVVKQVQQLQSEIATAERELDRERVEGVSGGGMVRAVFTGMGDLVEVKISPDAVDLSDLQLLEDLVATAVRDGITKAQERHSERMKSATGGINLPGMFGY